MKFNLRPRPSGEAARVVFKEYQVPVSPDADLPYKYVLNNGSDWSQGTPSLLFSDNNVHDAVQDLDGNIWFTDDRPSHDPDHRPDRCQNRRIQADQGQRARRLRGREPRHHSRPEGDHLVQYAPAGAGGEPYGLPSSTRRPSRSRVYVPPRRWRPRGLAGFRRQRLIWITTRRRRTAFRSGDEKFTEFKSNTFKTPHGEATVYGIAGDHDGNGWWLDMKFDHVEHGDIATGKTTEFQLPPEQAAYDRMTPDDKVLYASYVVPDFNTPYPWAQGPRRMGADKNGDTVWIGDSFGGNLARVDIHTMKAELVPLPNPDRCSPTMSRSTRTTMSGPICGAPTNRRIRSAGKEMDALRSADARNRIALHLASRRPSGTSVTVAYYRTDKVAVMTFRSEQDMADAKKQVQ